MACAGSQLWRSRSALRKTFYNEVIMMTRIRSLKCLPLDQFRQLLTQNVYSKFLYPSHSSNRPRLKTLAAHQSHCLWTQKCGSLRRIPSILQLRSVAIPEEVILICWRRRRYATARFSGARLGPHLWRSLTYSLGMSAPGTLYTTAMRLRRLVST